MSSLTARQPVTETLRPDQFTTSVGPTLTDLAARNGRPKKRRPTSFQYVGIAVLLVAAVIGYRALTGKRADTHLTATVKRGPFDVVVVETGELQAERSISITTPVLASGGRSQLGIQYLAPEGKTVDSSTLLVSFDPSDQMKILGDKENELKLAIADLDKLKVQQSADESDAQMAFENAKLSFELAKLANDEMKFESESKQRESKLELRKAELAYQQAEENIKSKSSIRKSEMGNLQLKIAQLQSAVDRTQADLQRLAIKATSSGLVVYQRSWNTGKKLTKGDQVWGGQPIIQLPDLSHMQAILQVNEVDVSKVKADQPVEVSLDAFPDKKFQGKVKSVASIGNPKENNPSVKVFEVIVDMNGADSVLKPGMTVAARITISKIDNVLSVPIESVFEDGGKTVVYVETSSGYEKRVVTLGQKNDNFIIITKGLKAGEKVSMTDPTKDDSADDKGKSKQESPKAKV